MKIFRSCWACRSTGGTSWHCPADAGPFDRLRANGVFLGSNFDLFGQALEVRAELDPFVLSLSKRRCNKLTLPGRRRTLRQAQGEREGVRIWRGSQRRLLAKARGPETGSGW